MFAIIAAHEAAALRALSLAAHVDGNAEERAPPCLFPILDAAVACSGSCYDPRMSTPVLDQYYAGDVAQQALDWNEQAHEALANPGLTGPPGPAVRSGGSGVRTT